LNWRAFSRGLAIHLAPDDGLCIYAQDALVDRGIPLDCTATDKASVTEDDLRRATRRIALLESEHRPYIRSQFPDWEGKVEYWHAEDLDVAPPDEVLPEIEAKVIALVRQLAKSNG
jgi:protein-tyrosine phosphatase